MHQMPYNNILAFVEGMMERIFVNNNFGKIDVIPVSNGNKVSIDKICSDISSFFVTKGRNPEYIIVWIDKEKREETVDEIRSRIRNALVSVGADGNRISICIGDRMTENIILSDEIMMRQEIGDDAYQYAYEGQNGKSVIKKILKEKNINYKETDHGVKLLKKIRLKNCSPKNQSVAKFLSDPVPSCWWI